LLIAVAVEKGRPTLCGDNPISTAKSETLAAGFALFWKTSGAQEIQKKVLYNFLRLPHASVVIAQAVTIQPKPKEKQ
jgi:hypothetical protein